MKLTCSVFTDKNFIPEKYTCDGDNLSPPLFISDVLPGTQSLVLIVNDPDAPGGDWVHWLMWGIKPTITKIPEGSVPIGSMQGLNDFGEEGYGGPCPPSGIHRYQFTLYALNSTLEDQLSPLSTKAEILRAIDGCVIDQTTLTGLYSKK